MSGRTATGPNGAASSVEVERQMLERWSIQTAIMSNGDHVKW
jgi:hypothetical protein